VYITDVESNCPFDEVCFIFLSAYSDGCFFIYQDDIDIDGKKNDLNVQTSVDYESGIFFIENADDISIRDLDIFGDEEEESAAVYIDSSTDVTLTDVDMSYLGYGYGVHVIDSQRITLSSSDVHVDIPLYCDHSDDVTVSNSEMWGYSPAGNPIFASIVAYYCDDMYLSDVEVAWPDVSTGGCVRMYNSEDFSISNLDCISTGYGIRMTSSNNGVISSPTIVCDTYGLYADGLTEDISLIFDDGQGSIVCDDKTSRDSSYGNTYSEFYMADSTAKVEWVGSSFLRDLDIGGRLEFDSSLITSNNYVELNTSYFTTGVDADAHNIKNTEVDITLYNVPYATFTTPVVFRDNVVCDATTTPACTDISLGTTSSWTSESFSNYTVGDAGAGPGNETGNNQTGVNLTYSLPLDSKYSQGLTYCLGENQTFSVWLYNQTTGANLTVSPANTVYVDVFGHGSIVDGQYANVTSGYWECDLNVTGVCTFTWQANDTTPFVDYLYVNMEPGNGYSRVSRLLPVGLSYSEDCSWINIVPRDDDTGANISAAWVRLRDPSTNLVWSSAQSSITGAFFPTINNVTRNVTLTKSGYYDVTYEIYAADYEQDLFLNMTVDPTYVPDPEED
jgi:hypothetical protein